MGGDRGAVRGGRRLLGALVVGALVAATPVLTAGAGYAAGGSTFTWHLDETSGSTMVDSTGGQNGTMKDISLGAPGVSGAAYGFNGSSSRVIVPDNDVLDPGDADVHISLWLRTTTTPAVPDYDLFRKGEAPGQEYKVEMQPNGQASCDFRGSVASQSVQNGPDLSDGVWHHIQCDKTATTVTLTVDGQPFNKAKAVGSITNGYDVVVGAYPSGDFYQGDLDEITMTFGASSTPPPVAPTASFTPSSASGPAPLSVDFEDTSSGAPTSWRWDFGDGGTSTDQNPSHSYTRPGSYTVRLTAANAVGGSTVTHTVTATDDTPPQGRFTAGPAQAWAGWTRVVLRQESLSDDGSAPDQIARVVDWGDGSPAVQWSRGSTLAHVYRTTGTHTPVVRLTDQAGNEAAVPASAISVARDLIAPTVRPGPFTDRNRVADLRRLHGSARDAQTGVASVRVKAVERRHGHWFAYDPGSGGWTRSRTQQAALHHAGWIRVVPRGGLWSHRLVGLRRGRLVLLVTARDHAGNVTPERAHRYLLAR